MAGQELALVPPLLLQELVLLLSPLQLQELLLLLAPPCLMSRALVLAPEGDVLATQLAGQLALRVLWPPCRRPQ